MDSEEDDRTVIRPRSARTGHDAPVPPSGPPDAPVPTRPLTSQPAGAPPGTPQHHAITLPTGTRLGEFELTGTIGEGGFGIVYLAWDHSLERKVALKEYMPSSIAYRDGASEIRARSERHQETFDAGMKSFINEAKLLAQFDHPSLLKVYRFWEANGTAYMVMPFLEGATLRDTVRGLATPPDEAWLLSLLAPVCDALSMLHAAQVYHRDIAPDNILLLAETGRPLLLDFGAARRVIGDMTQALTAILKPGYAPVEQYAEMPGMKQGPWTDVYALAAVVHWMILGKTPTPSVGRLFDDAHVPLVQSARGRYSETFLAAIDRALAVTPDKRTPSVEAFRADLVGQGRPAAAPAAPAAAPSRPLPVAAPAPAPSGPLFDAATTRLEQRTQQPARTLAQPRDAAAAAADAGTPRPRSWAPLAIGAAVVVVAALAAVLLWPKRVTTVQDTAATAPATTPPAVQSTPVATPTVTPVVTPAETPPADTLKPTTASVPPAAEQAASAGVVAPPVAEAASAPVVAEAASAPVVAEKPRTETRVAVKKPPRTEARQAEARPPEAEANVGSRSECARLFQRLSIGDTDQALIDRIRTLRCR